MVTRRRKSTRALTTAAICAALGVVILALGSLIEVLDLTAAAFASFNVIFAVIELKGKYPYLIYGVTAALALVLLPTKTPAVIYALILGYYPIIKERLEGKLPKALAWVLKIVIFNAGLALTVFLAMKVFLPGVELFGEYGYLWLLLCTPVFVLYDVALTRLITFYFVRVRHRLRFLRKD